MREMLLRRYECQRESFVWLMLYKKIRKLKPNSIILQTKLQRIKKRNPNGQCLFSVLEYRPTKMSALPKFLMMATQWDKEVLDIDRTGVRMAPT